MENFLSWPRPSLHQATNPLLCRLLTSAQSPQVLLQEALPVSSSLVRQAQLGASYRVPCPCSWTGSPHRAKLNQQPVASVARLAESDTWRTTVVKRIPQGHFLWAHREHCRPQGRRTSPKQFSPVSRKRAVGDGFNVPEASTQRSLW